MKTRINNLTKYFVLIFVVITMIGCSKFGDLNTDPTKSSNLDAASQLAFAQLRFSGDLSTQERTNTIMLLPMMQQLGGAYYTRYGGLYIKNLPYLWVLWENSYGNDISNIVDAAARTTGDSTKTNLNAMCRIVKVYAFARMTDMYGDIPYFEAGKAYSDGIKRPAYTAQKDIYDDFLKELTAASAQLSVTRDKVTKDIFYAGDILSWKKFANSLRLRLALRLVKRDPERAKAEVVAAYNAGVFTSNSDICMTKHEDVQNTYADIRGNSVSVGINQQSAMPKLCTTLLDQFKNTSDPRLNYIPRCYKDNTPIKPFEREDITTQVKAKVGLVGCKPGRYTYEDPITSTAIVLASGVSYTPTNVELKCQLNNCFIRNNAPFLHITYAETEFLLADASVRLNITLGATAAVHYANGITAAMQQLSLFPSGPAITTTEINTFITANPLVGGKELEQINTQLWIALLLNGPEAFANWRRTGFPNLVAAPSSESTSLSIPRRFQYPLSEKEQNATNVTAAISILGEDDWLKRVWWDQQ